jgi:hypothetical protein
MIPINPQNTPILNVPATLKLVIKSIGIMLLSGFGGNEKYAIIITMAYMIGSSIITVFFDDNKFLLLVILFPNLLCMKDRANAVNPEVRINPTYNVSL